MLIHLNDLDEVGAGRLQPSPVWFSRLAIWGRRLEAENRELNEKLSSASKKIAEQGHVRAKATKQINKLEEQVRERERDCAYMRQQIALLAGTMKEHLEVKVQAGVIYTRFGRSYDDGVVRWHDWK